MANRDPVPSNQAIYPNEKDAERTLGRITNEYHLQALMIAAMIFATLTGKVVRYIAKPLRNPFRLSMEKTAKWLSQWITFIRSANEMLTQDLR